MFVLSSGFTPAYVREKKCEVKNKTKLYFVIGNVNGTVAKLELIS